MGEKNLHRLRRLGVVKGTRNLKPVERRSRERFDPISGPGTMATAPGEAGDENLSLEILFPGGRLVDTELGACFVLDQVFPLSYKHGDDNLGDLIESSISNSSEFTRDQRLEGLKPEDLLFLDTETTGLSGAGTIAFMVGVAFIESTPNRDNNDRAFVVRQFFLRDHGDEPAMLLLLSQLLDQRQGLVTFNGRAFDLPLLDTRYLMNRLDYMVGDLRDRPHIDLLLPARRLWRNRIGSCSLGSLEQNLLGLQRAQEDIPGWAIPGIYLDYLRTRDAREMSRVFYHNQVDMLSMATLITRIMRQYAQPQPDDYPLDLLSLARWQMALGQMPEAEEILRSVTTMDLPLTSYHQALHTLGMILKRSDRRSEAIPLWQQIAVTTFDDVSAHVELAKAYEWHIEDLEAAHRWTREALSLYDNWDSGRDAMVYEELLHRLKRLEHKISKH